MKFLPPILSSLSSSQDCGGNETRMSRKSSHKHCKLCGHNSCTQFCRCSFSIAISVPTCPLATCPGTHVAQSLAHQLYHILPFPASVPLHRLVYPQPFMASRLSLQGSISMKASWISFSKSPKDRICVIYSYSGYVSDLLFRAMRAGKGFTTLPQDPEAGSRGSL